MHTDFASRKRFDDNAELFAALLVSRLVVPVFTILMSLRSCPPFLRLWKHSRSRSFEAPPSLMRCCAWPCCLHALNPVCICLCSAVHEVVPNIVGPDQNTGKRDAKRRYSDRHSQVCFRSRCQVHSPGLSCLVSPHSRESSPQVPSCVGASSCSCARYCSRARP